MRSESSEPCHAFHSSHLLLAFYGFLFSSQLFMLIEIEMIVVIEMFLHGWKLTNGGSGFRAEYVASRLGMGIDLSRSSVAIQMKRVWRNQLKSFVAKNSVKFLWAFNWTGSIYWVVWLHYKNHKRKRKFQNFSNKDS